MLDRTNMIRIIELTYQFRGCRCLASRAIPMNLDHLLCHPHAHAKCSVHTFEMLTHRISWNIMMNCKPC